MASVASSVAPENEPTARFIEGTLHRVSADRHERNPKARQACIEHYSAICFACGFDFARTYGELGAGFVEVHHLKALASEARQREVDPIADPRPLCSNCHAMVHCRPETLPVEELRDIPSGGRRN